MHKHKNNTGTNALKKAINANSKKRKNGIRINYENGFKPDQDYISQAVNDFLASGGRIKKMEFKTDSYENFIANNHDHEAYDFLNDGFQAVDNQGTSDA